MAHLWIEEDAGYPDVEWTVAPLNGPPLCFGDADELPRLLDGARPFDAFRIGDGLCITASTEGEGLWCMLCAPKRGVKINGVRVAGARRLDDRDEIVLADGRRYFYSAESLAVIELLPETGEPVPCLHCRDVIPERTPAVRCPECGGWYHQWPEGSRACWQASAECASCGGSVEAFSTVRWSPERL